MRSVREQRGRRGDQGQVTVMIVGFFVLAGLVVALAVDASAAYLGRRHVADLADGAALAASEAVARSELYAVGETVTVDAGIARASVADYLERTDAGATVDGLRWSVEQVGGAVRVTLRGQVRLPLSPPGWDRSASVAADAVVELRVS